MDVFRSVPQTLRYDSSKMKKNPLFASERFFCDVYAFEPGQSQAGHRHPESDKIYFVLTGRGVFRVDDQEQTFGAGMSIYCPAGSEHEVTNPGPDRLALLVFMAPPPAKPAK